MGKICSGVQRPKAHLHNFLRALQFGPWYRILARKVERKRELVGLVLSLNDKKIGRSTSCWSEINSKLHHVLYVITVASYNHH